MRDRLGMHAADRLGKSGSCIDLTGTVFAMTVTACLEVQPRQRARAHVLGARKVALGNALLLPVNAFGDVLLEIADEVLLELHQAFEILVVHEVELHVLRNPCGAWALRIRIMREHDASWSRVGYSTGHQRSLYWSQLFSGTTFLPSF